MKKPKLKRIASLIVATALAFFQAEADAETGFSDRFNVALSLSQTGDFDWAGPLSPWSPYLDQNFASGLAPDQRLDLENAVEQGRCEVVLTQMQSGFLQLYSELRPLFADDRVRENFETEILRGISPAYLRCNAHELIIPVIEAAKRRMPGDEMFFGLLPTPVLFARSLGPEPFWRADQVKDYSTGIERLVYLGACRRNADAISDLYGLADSLRFLPIFSEPEVLYLEYLAERVGVNAPFHITMREQVGLMSGESFQPGRVRALRARLVPDATADPMDLLPQLRVLCASQP